VPQFTRRSMLAMGLGTVGAGLMRPSTALAARPEPAAVGGVPLRPAFLPAVGSTFLATAGATRHRLTLVEILDLAPALAPLDDRAFNLIFELLGKPPLKDGIYRLTSAAVPTCSLFLSHVDLPTGRRRVQALVNRRTA
jgi:hypothetical protein